MPGIGNSHAPEQGSAGSGNVVTAKYLVQWEEEDGNGSGRVGIWIPNLTSPIFCTSASESLHHSLGL